MRSSQLILISLLYLFLGLAAASALPNAHLRRDDPATAATSGNDDNFPALTTSTRPAPSSTDAPASHSTAGSPPSTMTMASAMNGTTITSPTPTPSASIDPASDAAPLPLEPVLTAPLAIGGVILLISGIIYTFVGIKSGKVQVFISTSYLISLGTTVLIVYVMTTPVSVGTQGAYLAAIVLPGLILAAGAVVFKDVTEGLGCAVGGFAFGMWFMTLKPGGLVTSQAGKIVLLCCFTGVAFSLSFSRYTRTYGLIGATAFAGATAMVLGIDCFAKTGLKEFWLYIWGLNNNLFPLGTHTYPLTKNIKAEIAGIVIVTLFGILSQIQVWKIVQKKRAERAEVEEQKKREKEDEEARLGKDLEARTQAEKLIWERTYADAPRDVHSDSGIGSERSNSEKGGSDKGSARNSISERQRHDEAEDVDESGQRRQTKAARRLTPHIIVSVAEEEEETGLPSPRSAMTSSPTLPPLDFGYGTSHEHDKSADVDVKVASVNEVEIDPEVMESLKAKSLKPKTVPTPVVVPLPFNIPDGRSSMNEDRDDASSVATAATTVKRASKRYSTNSLFEKMAKGRMSWHAKQPSDATSVQAVADSPTREQFDVSSLPGSRKASIDGLKAAGSSHSPKPSQSRSPSQSSSPRTDYFTSKPSHNADQGHLSPALKATSPSAEDLPTPASQDITQQMPAVETPSPVAETPSPVSEEPRRPPPALNLDSIKANTSSSSKVMNAFRTNEWAKHLEGANEPEDDNIPVSEPPSPIEPEHVEFPQPEPVAQVEPQKAEEVHVPAGPSSAPESEVSAPTPTTTPPPAEEQAPKASWPKPSSRRRTSGAASQLPAEAKPAAVTRQTSREGRNSTRMALRSSSGSRTRGGKARQPSQQALVASPIHEDVEASFPQQQLGRRSSLGMQPDSLLAQREAMVSQSSIVRSSSQLSQHAPGSGYNNNASRLSLAQSQARPTSTLSRRSSNPDQYNFPHRVPSAASLRSAGQPYSPPPPVRTYSPINMNVAQPLTHAGSTPTPPPDRPLHYKNNAPDDVRRTSMLAQWRASLAGEQQQRRGNDMEIDVAAGQGWLDMQRQQRQYEQYRHQAVGWGTEQGVSPSAQAQMGMGMGMGMAMHNPAQNQMAAHEAHREILRRMQSKSKVNK